jgi:hypothetical protein
LALLAVFLIRTIKMSHTNNTNSNPSSSEKKNIDTYTFEMHFAFGKPVEGKIRQNLWRNEERPWVNGTCVFSAKLNREVFIAAVLPTTNNSVVMQLHRCSLKNAQDMALIGELTCAYTTWTRTELQLNIRIDTSRDPVTTHQVLARYFLNVRGESKDVITDEVENVAEAFEKNGITITSTLDEAFNSIMDLRGIKCVDDRKAKIALEEQRREREFAESVRAAVMAVLDECSEENLPHRYFDFVKSLVEKFSGYFDRNPEMLEAIESFSKMMEPLRQGRTEYSYYDCIEIVLGRLHIFFHCIVHFAMHSTDNKMSELQKAVYELHREHIEQLRETEDRFAGGDFWLDALRSAGRFVGNESPAKRHPSFDTMMEAVNKLVSEMKSDFSQVARKVLVAVELQEEFLAELANAQIYNRDRGDVYVDEYDHESSGGTDYHGSDESLVDDRRRQRENSVESMSSSSARGRNVKAVDDDDDDGDDGDESMSSSSARGRNVKAVDDDDDDGDDGDESMRSSSARGRNVKAVDDGRTRRENSATSAAFVDSDDSDDDDDDDGDDGDNDDDESMRSSSARGRNVDPVDDRRTRRENSAPSAVCVDSDGDDDDLKFVGKCGSSNGLTKLEQEINEGIANAKAIASSCENGKSDAHAARVARNEDASGGNAAKKAKKVRQDSKPARAVALTTDQEVFFVKNFSPLDFIRERYFPFSPDIKSAFIKSRLFYTTAAIESDGNSGKRVERNHFRAFLPLLKYAADQSDEEQGSEKKVYFHTLLPARAVCISLYFALAFYYLTTRPSDKRRQEFVESVRGILLLKHGDVLYIRRKFVKEYFNPSLLPQDLSKDTLKRMINAMQANSSTETQYFEIMKKYVSPRSNVAFRNSFELFDIGLPIFKSLLPLVRSHLKETAGASASNVPSVKPEKVTDFGNAVNTEGERPKNPKLYGRNDRNGQ